METIIIRKHFFWFASLFKVRKVSVLTLLSFLFTFHFVTLQPFNCFAQWQQTPYPSGDVAECLVSNGNNIYAGSTTSNIYHSSNNGISWDTLVFNLDSNHPIYSMALKDNYIFAGTSRADVFLSSNNGLSWIISLQNPFSNLNVIVVDGNNIYAGTGDFTGGANVYLSTDNGGQWSMIGGGGTLGIGGVTSFVINGNNIFAGTFTQGNNGIFLSTNNGVNWTPVNTGLTNKWITSMTLLGNSIFAGTVGGIFKTTNNGGNWVLSGLAGKEAYSFAVSDSNIFAGISASGVYLSTNYGTSWDSINTGLPLNATAYRLAISNGFLYASLGGGGVWKRSLSDILSSVEKRVETKYLMYPNPANNTIHIETGNIIKNTIVRIFNMNSQVVLEQPLQSKNTEVDISNFSSGIYFVRVQNEETVKVWKLIKE